MQEKRWELRTQLLFDLRSLEPIRELGQKLVEDLKNHNWGG